MLSEEAQGEGTGDGLSGVFYVEFGICASGQIRNRSCGVAYDELWSEGKVHGGEVGCLFQPCDETLDCDMHHLWQGLANGGKRGLDDLGKGDIVDADDGDILRDAQSQVAGTGIGTNRVHIVDGDEGGWRIVQAHDLAGTAAAQFRTLDIAEGAAGGAFPDKLGIEFEACFG